MCVRARVCPLTVPLVLLWVQHVSTARGHLFVCLFVCLMGQGGQHTDSAPASSCWEGNG